jgi:hypothetical protein
MDSIQELSERIASGEPRDQLYRDYRDLVKIHQLCFAYQRSAEICQEGLVTFSDSSELRDLLRFAQEKIRNVATAT